MTRSEIMKARWENPEYRERMSQQSKNLWKDENYIDKTTAIYKTDEFKKSQSEKLKGRKLSEETIRKMQLNRENKKRIKIDNIEYISIMDAVRKLKIDRQVIGNRLVSNNFPNYEYMDGTNINSLVYRADYMKNYRKKNPHKSKEYYEKNKDREKEYRKLNRERIKNYQKEYNEKNKDVIRIKKREYLNNKRKTDILFKLHDRIRTLINNSLHKNGYTKKSRTYEILGCSYDNFKFHLESQFEPWMCWENYGKCNGELNYGWDIDHIIPTSTGKTEEDIIKLNHYTNLRPLCSHINRNIKRNKVDY